MRGFWVRTFSISGEGKIIGPFPGVFREPWGSWPQEKIQEVEKKRQLIFESLKSAHAGGGGKWENRRSSWGEGPLPVLSLGDSFKGWGTPREAKKLIVGPHNF